MPRIGTIKMLGGAAAAVGLGWAGYAALAWSRYGKPAAPPKSPSPLDRFMPTFEVRELHETRVSAPAAVTYQSALALDLMRSPLVRAIFRGRELLMGAAPARRREQGFVREILAVGWGVLAEEPGRAMVFGAATQPWRADVKFRAIPADEFAAFSEPGYAKIAWTFWVDPLEAGTSAFHTETRVLTTDAASRTRFRLYWAIFSAGIRLIRHEILRLVREDAARRAGGKPRALEPVGAGAVSDPFPEPRPGAS
jgi:hypothetical protein